MKPHIMQKVSALPASLFPILTPSLGVMVLLEGNRQPFGSTANQTRNDSSKTYTGAKNGAIYELNLQRTQREL